jgi:multiple sugar transport system permease protein
MAGVAGRAAPSGSALPVMRARLTPGTGRLRDKVFAWSMLAPALVVLLLTGVYPYVMNAFYSLRHWSVVVSTGAGDFVGVQNFVAAFRDASFMLSIGRTLLFVGLILIGELLLGLGAALLFNRELRTKNVFRSLVLLPMMLSPVVTAVIWRMLYSVQFGVADYLLVALHLTHRRVEWLAEPRLAFLSLAAATVWMWFPFSFLVLTAALQGIAQDEYEAAWIDGASSWNVFRYITAPHLLSAIVVILLVRFIDGLKTFALILTLTGGGPGSATDLVYYHIYRVAFQVFDTGYSSALSIVVVLVALLGSWLIWGAGRRLSPEPIS